MASAYLERSPLQEQSYPESEYTDDVGSQDMEDTQNLWRESQRNRRQLEQSQNYDKYRQSTSSLAHYINENQDLKERLKRSEKELNHARDNMVILTRKLDDAEKDIDNYQHDLAQYEDIAALKTNQINRMAYTHENFNLSQKEIIERTRESNMALIHELEDKDKELQRTNNISKQRIDKLSNVSVGYTQAVSKIGRLESEVEAKNREVSNLRKELREAQNTITDLQQIKKSEGLAMLEIEHLKSDVLRLTQMLRTTKEYNDFADFADDNSGSIRYLKGQLRQTQLDSKIKSLGQGMKGAGDVIQRLCIQENLLDEKDVWMPNDAWKFAKEFRRTFNGEMTDELMDKLLYELNKIWSKREEQQIRRVKAQCAHEIMKLKRKLSSSVPFNEVNAKQTTNRLRNELKTSYKENRKAFDQRVQRNPPGIHYVNETIRIAKDNQRTKAQMTKENKFLRDQIKGLTLSRSQSGWNRSEDDDY